MIALSQHFAFLFLSLMLLLLDQEGLWVVILILVFACVELCIWARRERLYGYLNWCHPIPVFVLGYCIVYYQLPFCYLAGFELSYYSNFVLFSLEDIPYCVLLGAAGLAAFFCGEQISFLREGKISRPVADLSRFNEGLGAFFIRIKKLNTIVLVLTIAFFVLYLEAIGGLAETYFGFEYGGESNVLNIYSSHFEFAYTVFLYLAILIEMSRLVYIRPKSLSEYFMAWDKRILAVAAITLVPFILSGDRGAYLQPLALLLVPYFLFIKPLRFPQAVVVVVVAAFLLVLVGDTRARLDISWKQALASRIEVITNPAQWPTMELANSFGTFNIAVAYFPASYPYNNGLNLFYRFAALVPFSSQITEIEQKNEQSDFVFSSSLFFTNILTRGTFSSGSGTSSLADVYMDFGPYGVPVILFLWGIFMAWISRQAMTKNSGIFVFLYAYFSYYGIYVNRSSFFFGWNKLVWILLLFYFLDRLYLKPTRVKRIEG
jgi:oligosaccharide repeat unit polymerase